MELELEPRPFVLFGQRTPKVRLYTIGPEHLDWLCVRCGKTGNLDGSRIDRWGLALEQMSITACLENHEDDYSAVQEAFDRVGWELALRRCRRTAVEHLQTHLRYEQLCREDG